MVLGEALLKDVLRPPPVASVPANPAHPFQSSFYTYLTRRAIPKHWYLAAGFTFTLTMYGLVDGLRESGKKAKYDEAVLAGKQPCEWGGSGRGAARGREEQGGSEVPCMLHAPCHAPAPPPHARMLMAAIHAARTHADTAGGH